MDFSSDFPLLKDCTYLNTANSGLLSVGNAAWRAEHDEEFVAGGSNFRDKHVGLINQLRNNISHLFGAKEENTFLVPNFSIGFNILLTGLDKKHRFLLLKEDFPSVVYPITSMGFDYHEVHMDENMDEHILDAIEKFKPTVFAFSMVQYISGLRMEEAFIKRIKEAYPDLLLIADGTQFTGTTVFNFSLSGLDALAGSGYKWLLGGYGNGYVFLSDKLKEKLYQERRHKKIIAPPFAKKDYLSLCFEPGHLDTLNFGSLDQGLHYLQSLGMDFIEKTSQEISQKARKEFHSRGFIPDWMYQRSEQSTIISLPLGSKSIDRLNAAGILSSIRGNGLRISFHFYNSLEDLDYFLDVLDQKIN